MSARLVACHPENDDTIHLRFADGLQGSVCLGGVLHMGAFRVLRDPGIFRSVRIGEGGASVEWPGVRLAAEILHAELRSRGESAAPAQGPRHHPAADERFARFMTQLLHGQGAERDAYEARAHQLYCYRLSCAASRAWQNPERRARASVAQRAASARRKAAKLAAELAALGAIERSMKP